MDTVERRKDFAQFLKEDDGKTEGRTTFNEAAPFRWLVTEPYLEPGYFIDEKGATIDKANALPTHYPASALYNKPEGDVDKDWMLIDKEKALDIITKNGRKVPIDFICVIRKLCLAVP